MSLKELAALMKSALQASNSTSGKPLVGKARATSGSKRPSNRTVKRSGVTRDEIRAVVREELQKTFHELKSSIIEELRKELATSGLPLVVDEIVERVLQRLEERKRELQRERLRCYPLDAISEEEALKFLPLIREFSNSKRKFRGTPRCFLPSEFQRWLKEKGQEYDLTYIRGILRKLRLMGYLEKSSDSRYRLVRRDEGN